MKKEEFLKKLRDKLSSLPEEEIESRINYYDEIISDRIEDGYKEKEAIKALGSINDITSNIMYDMSIPALMKARISDSKKKTVNKGLWITLAILGFPLWLPLLLMFISIILTIYIVLWSIIICLYVCNIALCISGVITFLAGLVLIFIKPPLGLVTLGTGLACFGLSVLFAKPCIIITKAIIKLTALVGRKIKSFIIVKEEK